MVRAPNSQREIAGTQISKGTVLPVIRFKGNRTKKEILKHCTIKIP